MFERQRRWWWFRAAEGAGCEGHVRARHRQRGREPGRAGVGGSVNGTISQVTLANSSGKQITGTLSPDKTSFKINEPLGYGATYSWTGTAVGIDNKPVPINGKFTTLSPKKTVPATINIGDGQEVGIAAPIILQFKSHVENKSAVEKAFTVTTTPPTEGGWAWLPDDNGGSRAHWRPKEYWAPGTAVGFTAKLYGLDLWVAADSGTPDLTSAFKIGRSQIVKGAATTHRVQVIRDG